MNINPKKTVPPGNPAPSVETSSPEIEAPISKLPQEMVTAILSYLDQPQLIQCRAVCSRFVRYIDSTFVDKQHCLAHTAHRYRESLRPWLLNRGADHSVHYLDQATHSPFFSRLLRSVMTEQFNNALRYSFVRRQVLTGSTTHIPPGFTPDGRHFLIHETLPDHTQTERRFYHHIRVLPDHHENSFGTTHRMPLAYGHSYYLPLKNQLLVYSGFHLSIGHLDGNGHWQEQCRFPVPERRSTFNSHKAVSPDGHLVLLGLFHQPSIMLKKNKLGEWKLSFAPMLKEHKLWFSPDSQTLMTTEADRLALRGPVDPDVNYDWDDPNAEPVNNEALLAINVINLKNWHTDKVQLTDIPVDSEIYRCYKPDSRNIVVEVKVPFGTPPNTDPEFYEASRNPHHKCWAVLLQRQAEGEWKQSTLSDGTMRILDSGHNGRTWVTTPIDRGETLQMWEPGRMCTWQQMGEFKCHNTPSEVFSDSRHLLIPTDEGIGVYTDVPGQPTQWVSTIPYEESIQDLIISSDHRRVATLSDEHTLTLWALNPDDGKTWQTKGQLKVSDETSSISFSPDGRYLFTRCIDSKIHGELWEIVPKTADNISDDTENGGAETPPN